MQSTQFINSVGQQGYMQDGTVDLIADTALPGLVTFQQAYDAGLIELNKPFAVRVALDSDNWFISGAELLGSPVDDFNLLELEEPSQGSVPESSPVEVQIVMTAGQLNGVFSAQDAVRPFGSVVDIPYVADGGGS